MDKPKGKGFRRKTKGPNAEARKFPKLYYEGHESGPPDERVGFLQQALLDNGFGQGEGLRVTKVFDAALMRTLKTLLKRKTAALVGPKTWRKLPSSVLASFLKFTNHDRSSAPKDTTDESA